MPRLGDGGLPAEASVRPFVVGSCFSSTALDPVAEQRVVRVTHPFHPWLGREFVLVSVRQTWGEDRVFFLDEEGTQRSLPTGWTDAADPDPFVALAAGRSAVRVGDLLALVELFDGLRVADRDRAPVGEILP